MFVQRTSPFKELVRSKLVFFIEGSLLRVSAINLTCYNDTEPDWGSPSLAILTGLKGLHAAALLIRSNTNEEIY